MRTVRWRGLIAALVLLAMLAGSVPVVDAQVNSIVPVLGFPDADPTSGRFITVARGFSSLGDTSATGEVFNVSILVPKELTEFEVKIFDGEIGGVWDAASTMPDSQTFELFPDPDLVGNTDMATMLWSSSSSVMPDNDWFTFTITQNPAAYNADRDAYFYHLVAAWDQQTVTNELNSFKVAVQGQPFLLAGSTIGFIGWNDDSAFTLPNSYDGNFSFRFLVPPATNEIVIYDGDADLAIDSDDPNSDPFPPFIHSSETHAEGARNGSPPDDNAASYSGLIAPSVNFNVVSPSGWTAVNLDPSGDKEWEKFSMGLAGVSNVDVTVPEIPSGFYSLNFNGLDASNNVFVFADYEIYPVDVCDDPCVAPGTGTPGYWKNHPEAWPTLVISVGGVTYSQSAAIAGMEAPTKRDKTYNLFEQLVAAQLNVLIGNDDSCIADTIVAAQTWMTLNPLGSDVRANSDAWKNEGSALHSALDDYNNGRLSCAAHRE